MAFNPLKEKGTPLEKQYRNWQQVAPASYDTRSVHPFTRCRVIVMNGMEFERNWFLHQMSRHTRDDELRRRLARIRRLEQQQQKTVGALVPAAETTLDHTIGYEQVAVELTAWLARNEPDNKVKQALDFGLLEDFDHLYRYANIMDTRSDRRAEDIVGKLTEVTPGRPTVAEHVHPFDSVRTSINARKADIRTRLNIQTIVAAEQQTMNFYMNVANRAENDLLRRLYTEIGMIEEQHVSHYESLADPNVSWFERLLLQEYTECYLYHSFMEQEEDPKIRKIWERHLDMEIAQLQEAGELLKKHERRDASEILPKSMPSPVRFESNIGYVREILETQIDHTQRDTGYAQMDDLPQDHQYFRYNRQVNEVGVPSQTVVEQHIQRHGKDYRFEKEEHPVERFRDRTQVRRK